MLCGHRWTLDDLASPSDFSIDFLLALRRRVILAPGNSQCYDLFPSPPPSRQALPPQHARPLRAVRANGGRIRMRGITEVICLVPLDEIEFKSPDYARALKNGDTSWHQVMFPIVDYGVPKEREAYRRLILQVIDSLRAGTNVLAHCGAGIGRTGRWPLACSSFSACRSPRRSRRCTRPLLSRTPGTARIGRLGGSQHSRGLRQLTVRRPELPPGWVDYNPAISSITSRPINSSGSISCTLGMLMMYC